MAANGKKEEELQLIEPMVSASLNERLLENTKNMSATQRNICTRVHDVYAGMCVRECVCVVCVWVVCVCVCARAREYLESCVSLCSRSARWYVCM